MAVALKDKVATGLDIEVEFSIVELFVFTSWLIFSTFNRGMLPTARRGNNSENAVNLTRQGRKIRLFAANRSVTIYFKSVSA